jgi:copper(I)-binding protein
VRVALAFVAAVLAGACGTSDAPLAVSEAWVRAMPPGATTTAAYLSIENHSREPRVLASVTSPQFARAELHETRMDDGVARMRAVDSLALAPGERVALAPGGLHLMLFDPVRALGPGERVRLRFTLADGWIVEVDAEVRAP